MTIFDKHPIISEVDLEGSRAYLGDDRLPRADISLQEYIGSLTIRYLCGFEDKHLEPLIVRLADIKISQRKYRKHYSLYVELPNDDLIVVILSSRLTEFVRKDNLAGRAIFLESLSFIKEHCRKCFSRV